MTMKLTMTMMTITVIMIIVCSINGTEWRTIEYRSVTSQKNKFVKLWDLVLFSSKASLEKGPCQKLPRNSNSQPKYKG